SGLLKTEVGKVSDGSIEFDGRRIDRLDPEEIAKMGILQVLEGRQALQHLTIEENLRLGGYALGGKHIKDDLDMVYHYFPRLKQIRNRISGYCSGGEQQQMGIGRALMGHPKLMLLDEPSLGLAPLLVQEIFEIIKTIHEQEKTGILLVEQNARAAISIADYGYVMENGRIVMDGTAAKLADNEDVREFYMGLSKAGQKKSYREVKHYKRRKRWL
ncbi:MAG: ABC transporter ATP-binding protein, partial [Dehalococcoidia bacterium]|nr:ABC transporter ATP-binding protein [Dehalococcoidia bacterium]